MSTPVTQQDQGCCLSTIWTVQGVSIPATYLSFAGVLDIESKDTILRLSGNMRFEGPRMRWRLVEFYVRLLTVACHSCLKLWPIAEHPFIFNSSSDKPAL